MSPAHTPINRRVLREEIKERLMDAILRGSYQPGDRIVETRIAQDFGVSQAPVREAIRDLELMGFVESTPFKGASVRALNRAELGEVYPVRAALEAVAARLA
ncbi:MAG TPA: GntR family transcriptional regulator, partial [Chloroflexi bacterium]|nr:GntR family transcriptional regulator [Chloroflexota bacterium]